MALAASVVLAADHRARDARSSSGSGCPSRGGAADADAHRRHGVVRRRARPSSTRPLERPRRPGARGARAVRLRQVDAAARGRRARAARRPARSPGTARDLARVPTHKRGFALMFQDGQLFDHLTVAGNVGYALRLRRARRHRGPGRGAARRWSASRGTPTGCRPRCPAASGSGSRWPARWPSSPGCCCSTSRCRPSTPGCASGSPPTCATILRAGRHHRAAGHPRPRGGVRGRRPARRDAGRPDRPAGRRSTEVWRAPADPETALFLGYARVLEGGRRGVLAAGRRRADARPRWRVRRSALRVDDDGTAERAGGRRRGSRPSRCGWWSTWTGSASSTRSRRSTGTPAPGEQVRLAVDAHPDCAGER